MQTNSVTDAIDDIFTILNAALEGNPLAIGFVAFGVAIAVGCVAWLIYAARKSFRQGEPSDDLGPVQIDHQLLDLE